MALTPASGLITPEGKFVAENPGEYTVYATSSGYTSSLTIKIKARNIQKRAVNRAWINYGCFYFRFMGMAGCG